MVRGCAKKTKLKKSEITMEVGPGRTRNFFWENHLKTALNQYRHFGVVIMEKYTIILTVYILLKVVSYYDLSVCSCE